MLSQEIDGYAGVLLFKQCDCDRNVEGTLIKYETNVTKRVEEKIEGVGILSYSKRIAGGWKNDNKLIFSYRNWAVLGSIELLNSDQLQESLGKYQNTEDGYAENCMLVIQAYLRWGTFFAEHLNGSYSFALFNLDTREMIGVRDHIGIKQFYYWFGRRGIAFSNNLGGLQKVVNTCSSLENDFIVDYLLFTFPNKNSTIFNVFKTLPPAHILKANKEDCSTIQYWNHYNCKEFQSGQDVAVRLSQIVREAVNKRTINKKSLAIQLSGGIDSSSILAIMSEMQGKVIPLDRKLLAITRVFKDEFRDHKRDERRYAEEIAGQCSIPLHFCDDEIVAPLEYLSEYYEQMGNFPYNPFFAISNPSFQASQALGVETLVTGLGGDEIASIAGNNVFPLLFTKMQYLKLVNVLKQYSQVYDMSFWQALRSLVLGPLVPKVALKLYHNIQHPGRRREEEISFLHPDRRQEEERKRRDSLGIFVRNSFDIQEELNRNIYNSTLQHVFESYSYATTLYGIEFVHPLLDKDILAFISQVRPEEFVKYGWKRSLFRRAMIGILPETIRCRKDKSVFSLPYEKYIQASKELISDLLACRNCVAWDYLDDGRLKIWFNRLCDTPRTLKNVDLLALKIGMAVNVALFVDHNTQKQKSLTFGRLL